MDTNHLAQEDHDRGRCRGKITTAIRDFKRGRGGIWFVISLGVLALVYYPLLNGRYLIRDDYLFFKGDIFNDTTLPTGRFLNFWLYWLYHKTLSTIHWSVVGKVFSLIGVALLHGVLWRRLRLRRAGPVEAWLIGLMIVTLPAFILFVGWLVCSLYPYAMILAALSATQFLIAIRNFRQGRGWLNCGVHLLLALLLQVMSLLIYQPAAMMYYVFIAILLIFAGLSRIGWRLALGGVMAAWGMLGNVVYYFLYTSVLKHYGRVLGGRTGLVDDPAAKWIFFRDEVVYQALNLWNIFPARPWAIAVGALIALGMAAELWVAARKPGRGVAIQTIGLMLKGSAVAGLFCLSYLPVLATRQNIATYRTLMPPTAIVVAWGAWSLIVLVRACGLGNFRWLRAALLGAVALAAAVMAHHHAYHYLFLPHAREYNYLRDQLASQYRPDKKMIVFVMSGFFDGFVDAGHVRNDEFGSPTASLRWTPQWMVKAVCRDLRLPAEALSVEIVDKNSFAAGREAYQRAENMIVDMSRMRGMPEKPGE